MTKERLLEEARKGQLWPASPLANTSVGLVPLLFPEFFELFKILL